MTIAEPETAVAGGRGAAERAPRRSGIVGGTVLCGAALALLAGVDGTPGWQVVWVLTVAAFSAAAVIAERRLSPHWRGRIAVIVGVLAIVVAVGFAPHLAKGGPLLVQLPTAMVAAFGVGLTVSGTIVATGGHRTPRRIATGAAVIMINALVVFIVSPALAATNVPRPVIGATPASVGLAYEDVVLHAGDGVSLAGWYVPSANRGAVVLLHGAGSTRSDVLGQAAMLAGAGFGVLMVDARGHGGSGGRAMDFGWHGDADIAAATDYLTTRPDVDADRIGAVGMSMGGEEAIGATATNQLVRAVVAEGATARAAPDEAWLSDRYGMRGAVQEQLERVQDWVTDVLTDATVPTSMRSAVEASDHTRYLLITAGNEPDEGHAAAYVAAAAPERVETWTVAGAGHTAGLQVAPEAWSHRVVRFLTEALVAESR